MALGMGDGEIGRDSPPTRSALGRTILRETSWITLNRPRQGLPQNAYRELKEGEEYLPILNPQSSPPEVTPYSIFLGIIMAVIFSAAAAYSGLKIGQVFEAAIPIAILAVGISAVFRIRGASGAERHYPVHRSQLRCHRGRRHLHHPRTLHSQSPRKLFSGVLRFDARGIPWHSLPDPVPEVLCQGYARKIPVPGGDGDHGNPRCR